MTTQAEDLIAAGMTEWSDAESQELFIERMVGIREEAVANAEKLLLEQGAAGLIDYVIGEVLDVLDNSYGVTDTVCLVDQYPNAPPQVVDQEYGLYELRDSYFARILTQPVDLP